MMYKMDNQIQHYHWGAKDFLPDLLNIENPEEKPFAELWMGAHPKASSRIYKEGQWVDLYQIIQQTGTDFPFLFKILSIESPLSIQVHPSISQAREGFINENKAGIPLDASNRNYRDQNHKPEILVAISDFWALKGFRPFASILKNFEFAPREIRDHLQNWDIKTFYLWIMNLDEKKKQILLKSYADHSADSGEAYWVNELSRFYPGDISVLAPLYLNLVHLEPGEALYQESGELHAYLRGNGVELMANSDNVLRGGLTSKHMDLQELQSIVRFSPSFVDVLGNHKHFYPSGAEDFKLWEWKDFSRTRVELHHGPAILLNMGSPVDIHNDTAERMSLKPGESIFIDQNIASLQVESRVENKGHFFMATKGNGQ